MTIKKIGWEKESPVPDHHQFTQFLSAKDGRLYFDGLELMSLVTESLPGHNSTVMSPLEIVYLPIIRYRIQRLIETFAKAIEKTSYQGKFIYAYASKANAAEEVVRTILGTGVNYEISSWIDVEIVKDFRKKGLVRDEMMIIGNGFKPSGSLYGDKIIELQKLRGGVIPVIEDLVEIPALIHSGVPFEVGVRLKSYGKFDDLAAMDAGNSRFGMDSATIFEAVEKIKQAENLNLRVFHAMIGSQITDEAGFVDHLTPAIELYGKLRQTSPSLNIFDYGGGVPVQMALDFHFDYALFAEKLLTRIQEICSKYDVPVPDVMGEMGRYTVSEHGAHIFKVVSVKDNGSKLPWYIIDGSVMSSFPDAWALSEHFVVLPLNHLDGPFREVQIGGITCDSDDIYPPGSSRSRLFMPVNTEDLYVGFFNIGAYQEMLGGMGGTKHCVIPEADEVVIDKDMDGHFTFEWLPGQTSENVLENLGYRRNRGTQSIPRNNQ